MIQTSHFKFKMESHGILFCKECKNCLRPKNKITKSGKSKLTYYCSKCNYYYDNKSKNKMVIYNISYKSDSISKYTENDYLKYDPTIPHLKSMDCINPNCASNLNCKYSISFQYFKDPRDVRDYNFEHDLTLQLNNDLEKFRTYELTVINIAKNTYYVLFTKITEDITDADYKNMMSEVYTYLTTKKENKIIEANEGEGRDTVMKNANQFVNIENVVKNESDILFIKYDSANMRYLYKCCVCATHWKNK